MSKHLVIVESPAKAKTIGKYLGKDFFVLASYGHVRDLLPKEGAVDPARDFAMNYQVIEKNAKHLTAISKAVKQADSLYLAPDPDREGEAIAYHIYEYLKEQGVLKNKPVHRVVFHEITKNAVNFAVNHPRQIEMNLVNAQQARRALDYLVGFNLSPLLWKKIRYGLSAGRVQSPALRMIVEREQEIEAFVAQEYWTITAQASADKQNFTARLIEYAGEKLEQFSIVNEEQATRIHEELLKAAAGKLIVSKVEKKQRKRYPAAPFITSTLQQEAARKLGFTAQRTMRIAQQLYEGVETNEGTIGLITYMRTDSVNLAAEAIEEMRSLIAERFGDRFVPSSPTVYRTKSKNAQEAHEAIRPTSAHRTPDSLKGKLKPEQLKLYELIWKRAVACQMIPATIDTVSVDLACGSNHMFRANGSIITDPGFISVYQEGSDEEKKDDSEEKLLPPMSVGQEINLLSIEPHQHFTEPPPRYSEASLVKALEEHGIGRPSTYASIISTLQQRKYAELIQKRFHPTDVGRVVNRFLTDYFTQYVDYNFTAKLEDELDEVSRGEKVWIPLLKEFWHPFIERVENIQNTVQKKDVTQEALDEKCPDCGKPLSIRLGKIGRFIGCTGYPTCRYTRNIDGEANAPAEPQTVEGRNCPDCNSTLLYKQGRYGKFIGCNNYPKCKHIEPLEKPATIDITCPECHKGKFIKRKSRYGKYFYSCSEYPTCKYAVWNEPINGPCLKCRWPILTIKTTQRRGTEKVCPVKTCGHTEKMEE